MKSLERLDLVKEDYHYKFFFSFKVKNFLTPPFLYDAVEVRQTHLYYKPGSSLISYVSLNKLFKVPGSLFFMCKMRKAVPVS